MSKSKKPSTQTQLYHFGFRWSVEHNDENRQNLYTYLQMDDNVDHFIFQAELTTGEDGAKRNPHYQGYFHCKNKKRAKHLAILMNGEFRGINVQASSTEGRERLRRYCMKDETRVAGPWADRKVYLGEDLYHESQFFPWQKTVLNMLRGEVDDRCAHWIYDPAGNSGKTRFLKYVGFRMNGVNLGYATAGDTLNLVSKLPNRGIYCWNLTRTRPSSISESELYASIESVKDGMFVNMKYETREIYMSIPHIVVMSNHKPKFTALTADRWKMWTIIDKKLVKHI